jgi:hypothetical protein
VKDENEPGKRKSKSESRAGVKRFSEECAGAQKKGRRRAQNRNETRAETQRRGVLTQNPKLETVFLCASASLREKLEAGLLWRPFGYFTSDEGKFGLAGLITTLRCVGEMMRSKSSIGTAPSSTSSPITTAPP